MLPFCIIAPILRLPTRTLSSSYSQCLLEGRHVWRSQQLHGDRFDNNDSVKVLISSICKLAEFQVHLQVSKLAQCKLANLTNLSFTLQVASSVTLLQTAETFVAMWMTAESAKLPRLQHTIDGTSWRTTFE